MDSSRNLMFGAVALLVAIAGGAFLWWSSQPAEPDRTLVPGPNIGINDDINPQRREGVIGRPVRMGPDGQPLPSTAQGAQDTGVEPSGDGADTGLTRDGMIDEMLDDVAKDTGLSEEGRERMHEALLRARDGEVPGQEAP